MVKFFRSRKVLKDRDSLKKVLQRPKRLFYSRYDNYVPKLINIDEEREKRNEALEKIYELHGAPRLTVEDMRLEKIKLDKILERKKQNKK